MLIGVDIGGTKIEAAALDDDGATLGRKRVSTPRGDYDGALGVIRDIVADMEARFGQAAGVGIGTPGSLSPRTGLVRNANSTWFNGRRLQGDLEFVLRRPVRIENDANCLAVSEATDGAAAGAQVAFAVILGTGCGAGIAIDGRAFAGRNGVAGEFGHNALPWPHGPDEMPGPRCWCGKDGCVETYLSGSGFSARHAEAEARRLSAPEIVAAARQGEETARRSLDRYRDRLARALAAVVNLLDPDVIVLGGGMSNVDEIYVDLQQLMAPHVFSDGFDTPVLKAAHGDSSGVRGAAWLWRP
ncbi:ROK family protein [Chenggangzhangella methanolivorans]|uniref:ROK family protein n=1 Tax=Chenggangzhangella methanolivorans TaxID=1437009 RepID=A0A9E6REA7_9HYPH|nr:ROK family protein [Chenggangzhangella methanolivorans]QZO01854.1 ROK family protein [Chenggangzhangella methanolivorans]